jgi:hypothetical protein
MGLAMCQFCAWGFNYTATSLFPRMADGELGKVGVYAGMALTCAFSWLFVHRFVPETKDLTNDECVKLVQLARYTPVTYLGKEIEEEDENDAQNDDYDLEYEAI